MGRNFGEFMQRNTQTIYINIDDSGKISLKEEIAVYGGVIFLDKKEKDKFITQYRSIVNDIKCKYCSLNKDNCNNICPELKHSNLKSSDLRRLHNYIKNYVTLACVINNKKIYSRIVSDKASKGRFLDYSLRRLIKGVIIKLILEHKIDENNDLVIILNIDEQTTKSNGYYNLREGLIEELKYGIINYNYSTRYKPVIKGKLDIKLTYQRSDKSYVVQAADLVAGTTRKINIIYGMDMNTLLTKMNYINYLLFLPERKRAIL